MRIKKVRLPDGNVIADTGLPQSAIKPQYLELHREQLREITTALSDPVNMNNGVVYNMIRFMFSTMLDIGRREYVLATLQEDVDAKIDELEQDGAIDYVTRIEAMSEIALDCVPHFTDYLDTTYAVSHRVAIGLTGSAPNDDEMEYEVPTFDDDEVIEGKWIEMEES